MLSDLIRCSFRDGSAVKAVLSKPRTKTQPAGSRIDVRPVLIKGTQLFQFATRVSNQEKHLNLTAEEAAKHILGHAGTDFLDCFVRTKTEEVSARFKKSGECRLQRKAVATASEEVPAQSHDRQRQYLLPEGAPIPFLVETAIMTPEGKVRAKHYHKFRQINRYAEFIADARNFGDASVTAAHGGWVVPVDIHTGN